MKMKFQTGDAPVVENIVTLPFIVQIVGMEILWTMNRNLNLSKN